MKAMTIALAALLVFSSAPSFAETTSNTPIAKVEPGASVTVSGVVERLLDSDEFRLKDETGEIDVYIGWQNAMPVEVGEKVTVKGVADDDMLPLMRPDLYARSIQLEDGGTIKLSQDD